MSIDELTIRRVLNTILDPCSVASGAACGIDEMGLVRQVAITVGSAGTHVAVTLGLTEPSCLMGYVFVPQARAAIAALAGVAAVDVQLEPNAGWSESDMAPAYQARLAAQRASRSVTLRLPDNNP